MALVSLNGGVAGRSSSRCSSCGRANRAPFPWPSDSVLLVAVGAIFGLVGLRAGDPGAAPVRGRQARADRPAGPRLGGRPAHRPRRCAVMLSGSIGNSLLQLASLWFVLHAFGATVGIAVMGAVLFGRKALAGAAPTRPAGWGRSRPP